MERFRTITEKNKALFIHDLDEGSAAIKVSLILSSSVVKSLQKS